MAFRVLEISGLERAEAPRGLATVPQLDFPAVLLELATEAGLGEQESFRVVAPENQSPRLVLEHPETERPVVFSRRGGAWRLEEGTTSAASPLARTAFGRGEGRPEHFVAFQRTKTVPRDTQPALMQLDVGPWTWSPLPQGARLKSRVVLFLHGFSSSVESSFTPKIPPTPARKDTTSYLGFDHETWFHSPDQNANQLMDCLAPFQEALNQSQIVLVAHSRGGLVARNFFELARDRGWDVTKVTTFGTPHQGTTLAQSAFSVFNVLLNQAIQAVGVPSILARELGRALTALVEHRVLPGVDAMVPGSAYLTKLPPFPKLPVDQRPCHGAVYVPDGFWMKAADFLYTLVAFHGDRNDLVVDTDRMVYRGDTLVPFVLMKTHFEYFSEPPDLLTSAM